MSRFDGPRPLKDDDQTGGFSCGEPELDKWLTGKALKAGANQTARTYVVTETATGKVAAFYCLSAHSVSRADIGGGYLARNTPDPVPVILLGRLAVDTAFQRARLGSALLKDALLRTITAAEAVGARALIVHTINDEVAEFYLRFGFRAVPANPRTLFLPLDRLVR